MTRFGTMKHLPSRQQAQVVLTRRRVRPSVQLDQFQSKCRPSLLVGQVSRPARDLQVAPWPDLEVRPQTWTSAAPRFTRTLKLA